MPFYISQLIPVDSGDVEILAYDSRGRATPLGLRVSYHEGKG